MKESKQKAGNPERASSVPGVPRKSLIRRTHRSVPLEAYQNIIMFSIKDLRISNLQKYIVLFLSWTKFSFSASHLCTWQKKSLFLRFWETLISVGRRELPGLSRPSPGHRQSIISWFHSTHTQSYLPLKGVIRPRKHRYKVDMPTRQLLNGHVPWAAQCAPSCVNIWLLPLVRQLWASHRQPLLVAFGGHRCT